MFSLHLETHGRIPLLVFVETLVPVEVTVWVNRAGIFSLLMIVLQALDVVGQLSHLLLPVSPLKYFLVTQILELIVILSILFVENVWIDQNPSS